MSTAKRPQAVKWCFTINNYVDDAKELEQLVDKAVYLVYGREIAPETGTPHLQGYVVLHKKLMLTAMKKLHATAHWEIAMGTHKQASDYCKKDKDFVEHGELPVERHVKGGAATKQRYANAIASAKKGDLDSIEPDLLLKHYNTLKQIRADNMRAMPELPDCAGVWIYGPSGSGKSTYARTTYPDYYLKSLNKWFDGYSGQDNVILEDVDPDAGKFLRHHLKLWCDKHDFICECKGSSMRIRPKKFIITSQYSIDDVFPDKETRDALNRRCQVIYFDNRLPRSAPVMLENEDLSDFDSMM